MLHTRNSYKGRSYDLYLYSTKLVQGHFSPSSYWHMMGKGLFWLNWLCKGRVVITEGHSQSADLIYLISEDVRDKQFCMPGVVGSTYGHHLVSWHTSVRNIIPKQMSYLDCGNCPKEVPLLIKLMVLCVQEVWNRPFTGDITVCLGVFGGWPIKHNKPKTWSLGLFCQVVVCVLV